MFDPSIGAIYFYNKHRICECERQRVLKGFGIMSFLACCQGSKPVLESFSDIQCVFLEDSRRHCIFL